MSEGKVSSASSITYSTETLALLRSKWIFDLMFRLEHQLFRTTIVDIFRQFQVDLDRHRNSCGCRSASIAMLRL